MNSNALEFAIWGEEEWEEDSSESEEESDEEENIQYIDLMLALAGGAARKEGVGEGRREGVVVGALLTFVIGVILSFIFTSSPPAESCEASLRACQAGVVAAPSSWNPLTAVAQRDAALVAASSSWISSVLTPELALWVPAWRVALVWATGAVLLAAAQYMGLTGIGGAVGMAGLLITGRALPDLWSATTLGPSWGGSFPLQSPWEAGAAALGNAAAGWQPGLHEANPLQD